MLKVLDVCFCCWLNTNVGPEGEEEGGSGEKIQFLFCSDSKCLFGLQPIKNLCLNANDNSPPPLFTQDLLCAHFMFIQVNAHNNLHKEVLQLVPFSFKVKKQTGRVRKVPKMQSWAICLQSGPYASGSIWSPLGLSCAVSVNSGFWIDWSCSFLQIPRMQSALST